MAGIREALSRELEAAREFEALLEDERRELSGRAGDTLAAIAARKPALAHRVAEASRERRKAHGRENAECRELREEIAACGRRIRDLIRHNELVLNLRLQHVSTALSVLSAGATRAPVTLYSADGRPQFAGGRATWNSVGGKA